MAQVAANADIYAAQRIGVFFPGIIPSLDGQCVSLAKWFMQEMSEVPNPQAARGDARYVGKNLVAQGHATEVPYSQRRRGDLICYEYGVYGHIGVVLSGDRTFEENVNWPGVSSKIVDGDRVYAARIGSLAEGWRHDQHIYRLKTYKEGDMANFSEDQEKVAAYLATGSYPGSNYNYPFTQKDVNFDNLNEFLSTWAGRQTRITKQDENYVADSITGIKGVIGWEGYNSQFLGQPVVLYYPQMVKFWIDYAASLPKPEPGNVTVLQKGDYRVK